MKMLTWYLRQLLPSIYWSRYTDNSGHRHVAIWRMWFGKVFNRIDVIVSADI